MAVIRPWRRSGVALAVLLLVLDAASAAEVAQRPDEGWQPASPLTSTSRAAYASLAFEKAGCESALSVAVLGHNAELEHLVRSDLGADSIFHGLVSSGRKIHPARKHEIASKRQTRDAIRTVAR